MYYMQVSRNEIWSGGQLAMASAVARAYNQKSGAEPPAGVQKDEPPVGGQGAMPLKLKILSICTSNKNVKFVIFSVYLQYFARASRD